MRWYITEKTTDNPSNCCRMLTLLCVLLSLSPSLYVHGSRYGCTTVYEEVGVVKQEPKVTRECSTVQSKKCRTVFKTSVTTKVETQCTAAYDTVCKQASETGFKQDCVTVQDQECYVVVKKGKYDKHEPQKICSTVPKQKCSSVPTSVSSPQCINIPTQKCSNVPVTAPVQVPVQSCKPVPRTVCQHLVTLQDKVETVSVPREVCGGGGGGSSTANKGSSSAESYGGHRRIGPQQSDNGYDDSKFFLARKYQNPPKPSNFDVLEIGGEKEGPRHQGKLLADYLESPIYRHKRRSRQEKEDSFQTLFK